jgi:glycosyltransferase involved in cell wall biosynthesis
VLVSASLTESFFITTRSVVHGTPVIVADTPVTRSVVRHGVNGFLAPSTPRDRRADAAASTTPTLG